jgi:hypothetical protein
MTRTSWSAGEQRESPTARTPARSFAAVDVRAVRAMFNDAIDIGLYSGPNPFATCALSGPAAGRT